MPALPLIDLMILLASIILGIGFVEKAIWITTNYRPKLLGLTPMDFLLASGVCLIMALTLAARTWVKANEPRILRRSRRSGADLDEHEDNPAWQSLAVTGDESVAEGSKRAAPAAAED